MAQFLRHKTSDEIRKQCKAAGLMFDDHMYKAGSDFIRVVTKSPNGTESAVMYSAVNGRFFGVTPDGVEFNSDSTKHDNEHWFKALLIFFLVSK